jgi:hypothetical protein
MSYNVAQNSENLHCKVYIPFEALQVSSLPRYSNCPVQRLHKLYLSNIHLGAHHSTFNVGLLCVEKYAWDWDSIMDLGNSENLGDLHL